MKAAICTKYGPPDVLQLQEVEKPVPSPGAIGKCCKPQHETGGSGRIILVNRERLFEAGG